MEIMTQSGMVSVNKRTSYGKWLIGFTSTTAWTGWYTIKCTWNKWKNRKPAACSWEAWGRVCGQWINPLYRANQEYLNFIKELNEDWNQIKPDIEKAGVKIPQHGFYLSQIPELVDISRAE